MSNTKRDWTDLWFGIADGGSTVRTDVRTINWYCQQVEAIVRRELAGEVEKIHAELSEGDDLVSSVWKDCADCFRDDLRALLSPGSCELDHQNDAEDTNV